MSVVSKDETLPDMFSRNNTIRTVANYKITGTKEIQFLF